MRPCWPLQDGTNTPKKFSDTNKRTAGVGQPVTPARDRSVTSSTAAGSSSPLAAIAPREGGAVLRRGGGSLTVCGTGFKLGHVSLETLKCMKRATKLFYAQGTGDGLDEWAKLINPAAENLVVRRPGPGDRRASYEDWVEVMLEPVRAGHDVCVAFYGSCAFAVYASHVALRRAKLEGYPAKMLPGISCLETLFVDLGIDVGRTGMQVYQAADLTRNRRVWDPRAHLFLIQPSIQAAGFEEHPAGIDQLAALLSKTYGPLHEVIVYMATTNVPVIRPVLISQLTSNIVHGNVSIYIPPAGTWWGLAW
jgi:Tetrapyrrole (Corrin/Porphyrin) Methylases